MSLPTDFAYMYNAFTHPECRGRRLFSTGVALASKTLAGQGVSKVVALEGGNVTAFPTPMFPAPAGGTGPKK